MPPSLAIKKRQSHCALPFDFFFPVKTNFVFPANSIQTCSSDANKDYNEGLIPETWRWMPVIGPPASGISTVG
jgi:hypothetical protein